MGHPLNQFPDLWEPVSRWEGCVCLPFVLTFICVAISSMVNRILYLGWDERGEWEPAKSSSREGRLRSPEEPFEDKQDQRQPDYPETDQAVVVKGFLVHKCTQ